jgi:cytochrome c553
MKFRLLEIAFLSLLIASLVSCNDTKQKKYTEAKTVQPTVAAIEGKKLMEQKCNLCHSPSAKETGRIAPPMVAVKSHYLDDNTTKEEFANAIWNFVEKPTKAKSKMNGAVFNFGLMPYQPFKEDDIKKIANYIYDYKIEEPSWFKDHIEEESKGKMKYRNDCKSNTSLNASETLSPS